MMQYIVIYFKNNKLCFENDAPKNKKKTIACCRMKHFDGFEWLSTTVSDKKKASFARSYLFNELSNIIN